jgi:hypothetical protein
MLKLFIGCATGLILIYIIATHPILAMLVLALGLTGLFLFFNKFNS